jgi:hypothetical protein
MPALSALITTRLCPFSTVHATYTDQIVIGLHCKASGELCAGEVRAENAVGAQASDGVRGTLIQGLCYKRTT